MQAHVELVKSISTLLAEKGNQLNGWAGSEVGLLCGDMLHAADKDNAAKPWRISAAFGSRCHDGETMVLLTVMYVAD